jgi:hypothetical protein
MFGFLTGQGFDGWTALFLMTTVLTSITGFGFPVDHLLPSHVAAILSLVMLAVAILARYVSHLSGAWRSTNVVTAAIALYLNVFVLIVQTFMKVPAVHALAPTLKEPPFLIAQVIVMLIFIGFTVLAVKKFHIELARSV